MNEAVQRTFDAGKTRVSAQTVASVLRPLQPALRFSFLAPNGLVRHAQNQTIGGEGRRTAAIETLESDELQLERERKSIVPKQIDLHKASAKAVKAAAAARAATIAKRAEKRAREEEASQPSKA